MCARSWPCACRGARGPRPGRAQAGGGQCPRGNRHPRIEGHDGGVEDHAQANQGLAVGKRPTSEPLTAHQAATTRPAATAKTVRRGPWARPRDASRPTASTRSGQARARKEARWARLPPAARPPKAPSASAASMTNMCPPGREVPLLLSRSVARLRDGRGRSIQGRPRASPFFRERCRVTRRRSGDLWISVGPANDRSTERVQSCVESFVAMPFVPVLLWSAWPSSSSSAAHLSGRPFSTLPLRGRGR